VSNGLRLRVLRDNARLTRQAYVEFDLQAMMDDEVCADFALLWWWGISRGYRRCMQRLYRRVGWNNG
jgi:hypothetical protein